MKKILFALILCVTPIGLAQAIDDKTVLIESADKEMAAAIQKAQDTLDSFLQIARTPPAGTSDFQLKVIVSDSNGSEHLWISPFKEIGDKFVGIVADEPTKIKLVKYGQKIVFEREHITDWGYVHDGKREGNFTVCVLFKRMPESEVAQYRKQYGFQC